MTTETSIRARLSKPLHWLLVVSLACNLLVVGLLLGHVMSGGGPGRGPRPVEIALGPIARALEAEDRHAILHDLRRRPDLRPPGREERRGAFAEIIDAIRTEPFDRTRTGDALAMQAERIAGAEAAIREALLGRLAAMAPAERAAFATRLEAELEQGR